jgi:hypothetical protein
MHLKMSHSKLSSFLEVRHTFHHYYLTLNRIVIISKSVYYNLYIYFLIAYKILIWLPLFLMLEKQQKKKKEKNSACSFLSSRIYTDFVWGK